MKELSQKNANESVVLTFDFTAATSEMGLNDSTFAAPPQVTVATLLGTDATPLLTVGAAQVSGLLAKVMASAGQSGSSYKVSAFVTFSNGESRTIDAILPVR